MELRGFELANIRLSRPQSEQANQLGRPNECDVLYVRPLSMLDHNLRNLIPTLS